MVHSQVLLAGLRSLAPGQAAPVLAGWWVVVAGVSRRLFDCRGEKALPAGPPQLSPSELRLPYSHKILVPYLASFRPRNTTSSISHQPLLGRHDNP